MNDDGDYPLHGASLYGYLSIVKLLLKAGATIDQVNKSGDTALHLAAYNGNIQVVEALLNAGADKAMKDKYGDTALDKAQRRNHPAIVKLLRDWPQEATAAAAEVEAPAAVTQQQLSPEEQKEVDKDLLTKTKAGDEEGVRDLLAKGANPNGAKAVR